VSTPAPNRILSQPDTVEVCAAERAAGGRGAEAIEQRGQVSASANDGHRAHRGLTLPDHHDRSTR
jgi:hypothetical protein